MSYCCSSRTERFNAVFLLVLALGLLHPFAMEAQQTPPNVISEIRDALAGHKELSRVVNYLNLGEKEFLQNLSGTGLSIIETSISILFIISNHYCRNTIHLFCSDKLGICTNYAYGHC